MAPIAVMVVAITIGARALAGEEANLTMGLLLANPIRRRKVVIEKAYAMIALTLVVGVATWAGVSSVNFQLQFIEPGVHSPSPPITLRQ